MHRQEMLEEAEDDRPRIAIVGLKGEKKHRVTHFSGKREIDNVDRDERRKVFKNMYSGKRV